MMRTLVVIILFLFSVPTLNADGYINLSTDMSPVKSQGSRNTCSVFAATSLMEYLIKKKTGQEVDLSESYNYWAAKRYTLRTNFLKQAYAHEDGLAGFLAVEAYKKGSMLEAQWPYEEQNWLQKNDSRCRRINNKYTSECYTGVPPRRAKRLRYGLSPIFIPREDIGQFITQHKKPVVINVLWPPRAVDRRTGRVRIPSADEVREAIAKRQGHVITLVGYDARKRQFVYRNSYGTSWGRNGYGTIPESYILRYCEVCPKLDNLSNVSAEIRAFLNQASKGVSGTLTKLAKGEELPPQAQVPKSVFVKFPQFDLVYLPRSKKVQIVAAGAIVSSGGQWRVTHPQPHLYLFTKQDWAGFHWKINIKTQRLYGSKVGTQDKVKGRVLEPTAVERDPQRVEARIDNGYIVFEPNSGDFQLIAGGRVLSYGEDWRVRKIGPSQYHLQKKSWRDFLWLVDTSSEKLYQVTKSRDGRWDGAKKPLGAVIESER